MTARAGTPVVRHTLIELALIELAQLLEATGELAQTVIRALGPADGGEGESPAERDDRAAMEICYHQLVRAAKLVDEVRARRSTP